jgi:protein-tyrosine phosphatase
MIAHPERNRAIASDFKKIAPFVEMGCLFQLTASSVAGLFGSKAEKCSIKILENGLATVIASDAHNKEHRPPQLDHGRDAAAKIIGLESANKLVIDNPMAIAASQFQNDI